MCSALAQPPSPELKPAQLLNRSAILARWNQALSGSVLQDIIGLQATTMGVAAHLGIELAEYDSRIRTFIPDYDEMLHAAAALIPPRARTIVDLGAGTGALAERCLQQAPGARIIGIDADADVLALAARRLGTRAVLVRGSFLRSSLPSCDAVVASFALHHVRTKTAKAKLYSRIHAALRPGGVFVSVDCHPSSNPAQARRQLRAWKSHLLRSYAPAQAAALLESWSHEDVYVPLESEVRLIERANFAVEVLWRKGAFAVLMGKRAKTGQSRLTRGLRLP